MLELGSEIAIARVIEIRLGGLNLAGVYNFSKAHDMVQRSLLAQAHAKAVPKTASSMTSFIPPRLTASLYRQK